MGAKKCRRVCRVGGSKATDVSQWTWYTRANAKVACREGEDEYECFLRMTAIVCLEKSGFQNRLVGCSAHDIHPEVDKGSLVVHFRRRFRTLWLSVSIARNVNHLLLYVWKHSLTHSRAVEVVLSSPAFGSDFLSTWFIYHY